jgi:hypothetical protein
MCISTLEKRIRHKKLTITSLRPKNLKNDVLEANFRIFFQDSMNQFFFSIVPG